MAGGLLQASLNDAGITQSAASSFGALASHKSMEDSARKFQQEADAGNALGTVGGLMAAKYVKPGTSVPDSPTTPNIPTQSTDNTISTMLGAAGQRLFGGFLNSKKAVGALQSYNQGPQ